MAHMGAVAAAVGGARRRGTNRRKLYEDPLMHFKNQRCVSHGAPSTPLPEDNLQHKPRCLGGSLWISGRQEGACETLCLRQTLALAADLCVCEQRQDFAAGAHG
jgi:hypothetical protein